MRLRLPALLFVVVANWGCAALRAPLTCPEKGGPAWTEIESENFVLRTDAGLPEARAISHEFEQMHAALAFVLQRPPRIEAVKLEIVLFDRYDDFFEITGRRHGVGAYLDSKPSGDLEPRAVMVMPRQDMADDAQRTFQHELTHRFLRERIRELPPWLDEGLAEYYATLETDGGHIILGKPGDSDFSELSHFWWSWQGNIQQLQKPVFRAPTIAKLIEADHSGFHVAVNRTEMSNEEREQRSIHYTAAWKLVHFFLNGPSADYQQRFQTFFSALQTGTRARRVFLDAFAPVLPQMEHDFRAYLVNPRLRRGTMAFVPPAPSARLQERAMSDAEVHLLWARLLPWHVKEARERARKELDEALSRAPRSPEVRLRRAIFFLAQGELENAGRELDNTVAARPDDPRYLLARALWWDLRETKSPAATGGNQVPADLLERLARLATSPAQLEFVADDMARRGRLNDALILIERAVAAEPLCWTCEWTRALVLADAGRHEEALRALDRAIAITPEWMSTEGLMEERSQILKQRCNLPQHLTLSISAGKVVVDGKPIAELPARAGAQAKQLFESVSPCKRLGEVGRFALELANDTNAGQLQSVLDALEWADFTQVELLSGGTSLTFTTRPAQPSSGAAWNTGRWVSMGQRDRDFEVLEVRRDSPDQENPTIVRRQSVSDENEAVGWVQATCLPASPCDGVIVHVRYETPGSFIVQLVKQLGKAPRGGGIPLVQISGIPTQEPITQPNDLWVVHRQLPGFVIQQVVRRALVGRVRRCYGDRLRRDGKLQGKVQIRFVIGRDGRVTEVGDGGSDLPDKTVIACAISAFRTLTFPPPPGGTATVVYPMIFTRGKQSRKVPRGAE